VRSIKGLAFDWYTDLTSASIGSWGQMDNELYLIKQTTPTPNWILINFKAIKRKVKELGLNYKFIHCSHNGCMLCCEDDAPLLLCNSEAKGSISCKMAMDKANIFMLLRCIECH